MESWQEELSRKMVELCLCHTLLSRLAFGNHSKIFQIEKYMK